MPLTDQAHVEQLLQWSITANPDSVVTQLIKDAQALIESDIGRTVESDTRTETFDGGRRALFLKWWPVTGVTSVTEDGNALTSADYKFYQDGTLIRISGDYQVAWKTTKRQSIDVAYTGGYLTGEADHDMALDNLANICAEIVARAFRRGAKSAAVPAGAAGDIQSVSLTGVGSVTYTTSEGESFALDGGLSQFVFLTEDQERQLGKYRSLAVA